MQNIPRNKNQKADVLSKLASVAFNHLTKEILVETLDMPSMDMEEINAIVEKEGEMWMTPIINYLKRRVWPEDQNEARAMQMKIDEDRLIYHGRGGSVQKILPNAYALMCGPAASELRHSRDTHESMQHASESKVDGMDVLGPLPEAPIKVKFVIVAVDYFTKWIEAKPLAKTTGKEAHRTSLKTINGETPYSLTFESEAVIPAEIGMPTHRTMMIKEGEGKEEEMMLNLDLLTERREAVAIQEARSPWDFLDHNLDAIDDYRRKIDGVRHMGVIRISYGMSKEVAMHGGGVGEGLGGGFLAAAC
ncbi:reverse transcriptase domain-containing protein [Tanacetum coccineum]